MNKRNAIVLSFAVALIAPSCSSPTSPTSDLEEKKRIEIVTPDVTTQVSPVPPSPQRSIPFTMWFVGDPGTCNSEGPYLTAKMIPVGSPILGLGDFAHPRGREKDFVCFDDSWGKHISNIFPATGNHDDEDEQGLPYCKRFPDYCANGGYYSFDRESWHFVGLNSTEITQGQLIWLREDLRRNEKPCTVAFFHHPLFSSGTGGTKSVRLFWDELYKAGVDLVLNGHDHFWEVFTKQKPSGEKDTQGIRQITNGAGGVLLRTDAGRHVNSEGPVFSWGVGKLLLGSSEYSWEFQKVDGGIGSSGSEACNPKPVL